MTHRGDRPGRSKGSSKSSSVGSLSFREKQAVPPPGRPKHVGTTHGPGRCQTAPAWCPSEKSRRATRWCRRAMSGFLTQRSGCLANDLQQTLHCRLERGILAKSLKATPGELLNEKSRLEDVTQPKLVGATHNGIASDRMSWSRSFSAPVETTSTGEPKSASRSSLTWRRSKSELDASNSTKKSMSLPGRSSPRATDPKTETARPRWRRTTDRISSRRARTSASRDREPTSVMRPCYPAPAPPADLPGFSRRR